MLKNVAVNSVKLSNMEILRYSELQDFEQEYILSHIVRMSQEKGEWITQFTIKEYFKSFNPKKFGILRAVAKFNEHCRDLEKQGYLVIGVENPIVIKVTEKFAKLCEMNVDRK